MTGWNGNVWSLGYCSVDTARWLVGKQSLVSTVHGPHVVILSWFRYQRSIVALAVLYVLSWHSIAQSIGADNGIPSIFGKSRGSLPRPIERPSFVIVCDRELSWRPTLFGCRCTGCWRVPRCERVRYPPPEVRSGGQAWRYRLWP